VDNSRSESLNYILIAFLCFQTVIGYAQKEDSLLNVIKSTNLEFLPTTQRNQDYLETIFKLDQEIRNAVTIVLQQDGLESKAYENIIEKQKEIDRYLFNKMVDYLTIYGHPSAELGEIACFTPLLIFHHVSGTSEDLELKESFFPIFYQAYLKGSLESNSIYFYLFRLHSQIFNREFESELNEENQIEFLIQLLHLQKE